MKYQYRNEFEGFKFEFIRNTIAPVVESYGLPADLTLSEMKLCRFIDRDAEATTAKIAEHLGVSKSTVSRMLKTLMKKGVISRDGPDRGGSWKILWERE